MAKSDLGSSIILILFGAIVAYESWRMPRFESIGGTIYTAPGLVPGLLGLVIAFFGVIMLVRYLLHRDETSAPPTMAEAVASPGIADDQAVMTSMPDSAADSALEPTASELTAENQPSNLRMLVTLALAVIFGGFLIGRLPFWLAVFLFVAASILFYERQSLTSGKKVAKHVAIAVAIAAATAFAVPFVFEEIFLVNLP